MTGVVDFNIGLGGKRFELLCDAVPGATILGFLSNSSFSHYEEQSNDILAAARLLRRQVIIPEIRSDHDYESAFTTLIQGQAGGLVVGAFTFANSNKILALAAQHKIPTIYPGRGYVVAGGLMSYSPVSFEVFRQAGHTPVGFSTAKSPSTCR
jgi:putative ABC transport system substrate-binding protein